MNFDNAVKFFDLCRVSLEIYYYVVAFALVSDFVGKMTFAPFINFVNGTTDSGDGVLYQFDSSFDDFIISCLCPMLSMGREVACIKASFYIIADGKRKCKENMIKIGIRMRRCRHTTGAFISLSHILPSHSASSALRSLPPIPP